MNGDVGSAVGQGVSRSDWFRWYHVKRGNTLPEISRWWYGHPQERWWRRIWLANRRTIGENTNRLEAGDWLQLPYLGFSYHVEESDTLPKLAEWVYGDDAMSLLIRYDNDWIRDRGDIQAGSWIWIP
jgi:LysM domain